MPEVDKTYESYSIYFTLGIVCDTIFFSIWVWVLLLWNRSFYPFYFEWNKISFSWISLHVLVIFDLRLSSNAIFFPSLLSLSISLFFRLSSFFSLSLSFYFYPPFSLHMSWFGWTLVIERENNNWLQWNLRIEHVPVISYVGCTHTTTHSHKQLASDQRAESISARKHESNKKNSSLEMKWNQAPFAYIVYHV